MAKINYRKIPYLHTFLKTLNKAAKDSLISNINTLPLHELNSFLPKNKVSTIITIRKIVFIHDNNLVNILITHGSGIGIKTLDALYNYRKYTDFYYYNDDKDNVLLQWFYQYNKNHLLEIYGIGPTKADIIIDKINKNVFNLEKPLQMQLEYCNSIGKKCAFRIIQHLQATLEI